MNPPPATAAHNDWVAMPERSNALALRVMAWIAIVLGRRIARIVLVFVVAYFAMFAPTARKASRRYLTRALGRPATRRDVVRHLYLFATTILDRVWLLRERWSMFDIRTAGLDAVRDPHGRLLFGAHMGSFEAVRAVGREHSGLRVTLAMFEENARLMQSVFRSLAPDAQQDVVPLGHLDTMFALRDRLDAGGYVGILADRAPGNVGMRDVTLLGERASIPVGPFRLAAVLRRPIVFMIGVYRGGRRYDVHFETIADFTEVGPGQRDRAIDAAIDAYVAQLDHWCREAPYNWFNFYAFWHADRD